MEWGAKNYGEERRKGRCRIELRELTLIFVWVEWHISKHTVPLMEQHFHLQKRKGALILLSRCRLPLFPLCCSWRSSNKSWEFKAQWTSAGGRDVKRPLCKVYRRPNSTSIICVAIQQQKASQEKFKNGSSHFKRVPYLEIGKIWWISTFVSIHWLFCTNKSMGKWLCISQCKQQQKCLPLW